MRILTFSTLYPNAAQPAHGIFVEQRLRRLIQSGQVDTKVVAPVPWFPSSNPRFGSYARLARVPARDTRHGIEVFYPRYPAIPKVGMTIAPLLLALAVRPMIRQLIAGGFDFDVLDAHYYYPDGVAAALLGKWFDKPVVITARGTDINLIPQHVLPRRMILWAARKAAASITVCQALKDEMVRLGADETGITVLRNGVDLEFFRPLDPGNCRNELGWTGGRVLLSVGHLIERKGHGLIIEALASMPPDCRLCIVGDGPMRAELVAKAGVCGVADRVEFAGLRTQDQLRTYYSAADALVLASDREGMANVLLEALACGTPVVATPAWGTPEVLADPAAGVLAANRSSAALADACEQLFRRHSTRAATRRYAELFSWDATTQGQLQLFASIRRQQEAVRNAAASIAGP
jgi:glycosyltransferase involved in cell wall biosynthesis